MINLEDKKVYSQKNLDNLQLGYKCLSLDAHSSDHQLKWQALTFPAPGYKLEKKNNHKHQVITAMSKAYEIDSFKKRIFNTRVFFSAIKEKVKHLKENCIHYGSCAI